MATASLERTTSTAPTLTTKATISYWCKRGRMSGWNNGAIAGGHDSGNTANNNWQCGFIDTDKFYLWNNGVSMNLVSTRRARDTNAWYHVVWSLDSTQGTAADRAKLYVNGEQVTVFDTSNYPTQNGLFDMARNGNSFRVGKYINTSGNNYYFDGQLAHFHFVDGTAYPASTFGETDATTGIWKPKASPSGVSYGTNGFFLRFDNSANMGLDSSGQSNNWTTSGTIIQNKDTPSNVFNTLSPIDIPIAGTSTAGTLPTLSNANTSITNSNSAFREIRSNIYVTKGKYYFEAKPTRIGGSGAFQVGVQLRNYSSGSGERRAYQNNGYKYTPGSASYGASYAANDVVGVALNLTDGEITFYKNGVSQGVAATDMLSGMDNIGWTAAASCYDADAHFNFGNGYFGTTAVSSAQNPDDGIGIFEYDPPTGYKALCTKSINAQEYS